MVPDPSLREPIASRLHLDRPLHEGATIGLDHDRAHYLRSVLRLEAGAAIALFNGRDGEWLARIEGLGKGWCSLRVDRRLRAPQQEDDLWLIFAPIKRARIDFIAEKATELGCSRLQPVMTRFTDVTRVNVERLAANAREAAEQCRRLTVPEVQVPIGLARLLESWPNDRRLLVCAESGPVQPIAEALGELAAEAAPRATALAVLVGPEGGFAPEELEMLGSRAFVSPVGLGPRVLRAETAALAALACVQAILGSRDRPPPG